MHEPLLRPIIQALSSTGPLDPTEAPDTFQRLYVPGLHPGRFGGALSQLQIEIEGAEGGQHIYLFSGTVGSGKSTELRRMAQALRSPARYVAVVNITDYLNPEQELNFADLLLAMAMGLLEDLSAQFHWDSPAASLWDGLRSLLGAEVEVGAIDLKVVKLNLRQRSSFRDTLRQRFAASPGEFLAQAQRFFEQLASETQRAQRLLIVDSLEHFGGRRGKDDPILKSLRAVFQEHTDAMRVPGWQTVYSVPPLLPKLAPGVLAVVGAARLYQLTSAHVYLDRSERPDDTMIARLVDLIDRRSGAPCVHPRPTASAGDPGLRRRPARPHPPAQARRAVCLRGPGAAHRQCHRRGRLQRLAQRLPAAGTRHHAAPGLGACRKGADRRHRRGLVRRHERLG
jgi:hypothetical protein